MTSHDYSITYNQPQIQYFPGTQLTGYPAKDALREANKCTEQYKEWEVSQTLETPGKQ